MTTVSEQHAAELLKPYEGHRALITYNSRAVEVRGVKYPVLGTGSSNSVAVAFINATVVEVGTHWCLLQCSITGKTSVICLESVLEVRKPL
jgi:hypothetical protein